MKITGGQAKGILIKVSERSMVRPATDYLRQAIFSSLGDVSDAHVLDLFAGTGGYGLEAWSRGAASCVFIEKDRNCLNAIKQNIEAVAKSAGRSPSDCKIIHADVFKASLPRENQFDLIFADPPYEITNDVLPDLLHLASTWLKKSPESRLIIEAPGQLVPPIHSDLTFLKKLGKDQRDSPAALIWNYCLD